MMAGGCLIHDGGTWRRYTSDHTHESDNLFNLVPSQEHWIVQGRPMAGMTADSPSYPEFPNAFADGGTHGGMQATNSRSIFRYVDFSGGPLGTGGRTYGPAINLETNNPCTMLAPGEAAGGRMWCYLDLDHVIMSENTAQYVGAGTFSSEFVGDGNEAQRASKQSYVVYRNNLATTSNGAYVNSGGTQFVGNAIFDGNNALLERGGAATILNTASVATTTFTNSQFTNNIAVEGGALYVFEGAAAIVVSCVFSGNEARANGGAIANIIGGSIDVMDTTFTDNTARGYAGSLLADRPVYIKLKSSTFSPFVPGSDSVYLAGRQAGCSIHPCAAGESCSYDQYSITCTPCADNLVSSDGLTCTLCTPGTGPNDAQTACDACTGNTFSQFGVCTECDRDLIPDAQRTSCSHSGEVIDNHCDESECPTCPPPPAVVPCPAPTASSGRRRQLQPVEAVQSLLPFLGPLLAVMGIAARVYH